MKTASEVVPKLFLKRHLLKRRQFLIEALTDAGIR